MQHIIINELADAIFRAKPSSRGLFIMCIKQQLGRTLRETIDSHNTDSVIFIIEYQGSALLLKAEFGSNTATHKEAAWYERIGSIALGKQGLFLASVSAKTFALVMLRYVEGAVTLDEWALEHPAEYDRFGDFLLAMLAYDKTLFTVAAKTVPQETTVHMMISKYDARRKAAAAIPYLDSLFSARHITINSQVYLTPDNALKQLLSSKALREKLLPESVGCIHGDLHTGNTLIKNESLYYVDPNGNFGLPLEYDIAKMLHSVHGLYPVIMRGAFQVGQASKGGYDFAVTGQPIYSAGHQRLKHALDHEQYLRSVFIEALHFVTMLPHHAKNQPETTALFLRSVQLFDELRAFLK